MKIRLFRATVESVLLYGSETWTISQAMAKRINGSYSRMLRMALNIRWPNVISNADLFGSIPMPTVMIAKRRMRLVYDLIRSYRYCKGIAEAGPSGSVLLGV
ncbi:hypothetical protein ACHWQZ_G010854 [Mnemiopsis leidyi]